MKKSIEPPQNALVLRLKVVETNNENLTQNAKHTTAFELIRHRRDRKRRMQRLKTIRFRTKVRTITDTGRKA